MLRAVVTLATTAALLTASAPAAVAGDPGADTLRFTYESVGATWGWHRVALHEDGSRTFRTAYLIASWGDVVEPGGEPRAEDNIYAHTEDYTYDANDRFVTRVNHLFAGTRDSLTWTFSDDRTSARLTGTMTDTVCDTWYEVCEDAGTAVVDVTFTADEPPLDETKETYRPTRWSGQLSRVFWGFNAYDASATGSIGPVALRTTPAASYGAVDALGINVCRNQCEYWP